MNRWYVVIRGILSPFVRLLYPLRVEGREKLLGHDVGLVLCSNHPSAWDPVLICVALGGRFPIRVMAKRELMKIPILGFLLRKIGVFGVDRSNSDVAAVKTAIRTIRDKQNLLIFPEGTRSSGEGVTRPKGGVAMIAIRTGAMLAPVYIDVKKRLFHRVHIVFGEPYYPAVSDKRATAEEYQEQADEVMRRAYALGRAQGRLPERLPEHEGK